MEMRSPCGLQKFLSSSEKKKFYGKVPKLTISPNIKHLSYKSAAVKGNNLDTLGCRELPKGLGGRSYLSMSKFP